MKNVEIPINNRTVETVLYNRKFFAQLHGFLRMKKVAKDIARCTLKGPKMSKNKLRKHCSNYLVSKKMTVLQQIDTVSRHVLPLVSQRLEATPICTHKFHAS